MIPYPDTLDSIKEFKQEIFSDKLTQMPEEQLIKTSPT